MKSRFSFGHILCFILVQLAMQNVAAQKRTFIREYSYKASEADSKVTSRQKALAEVKALLIEELGTYVESYVNHVVTDKNGVVTKDFFTNEIKTLSTGITETKILEERWDGYGYYIKAEIVADPEEVVPEVRCADGRHHIGAQDAVPKAHGGIHVVGDQRQMIDSLPRGLRAHRSTSVASSRVQARAQTSLNGLNQQLIESKTQLASYQAQEKRILSEIEEIEQTMKDATSKAVANVRIGMTPAEVIRVCGKARVAESCDNMNYGAVWVLFESGIVMGMIDSRDYKGCLSVYFYKSQKTKFILE